MRKLSKIKTIYNLLAFTLAFVLVACNPSEGDVDSLPDLQSVADLTRQRGPLIDQQAWRHTPFHRDPFGPSANAMCDAVSGIGNELLDGEETIAILTDFCPWATVEQTLLVGLKKGDDIQFRIWHFELTGQGPARISIRIGDWVLFDRAIEKPSKAQLIADSILVPYGIEIGSQVYFHVDNHGANEYSLIQLSND